MALLEWLEGSGAAREEPPFLVARNLLVSGYLDSEEVEDIARLIASMNPEIPYSFLAFHPEFRTRDLPVITSGQAYRCLAVAEKHLRNVRLGNVHLLG